MLKNRSLKVAACKECNSLLSNSIQDTLAERKKLLKQRLKRKYKKILAIPNWKDEELVIMEYNMKKYILDSLKLRELTRLRLEY